MERLRPAAASLFFAYRRVRARPAAFAGVAAALGAAVALIGWSSLTAADANETSVATRLRELPPRVRALQVVYFTLPGEPDFRSRAVSQTVATFRDATATPRRVRISHSVEPGSPLGTRLVVVGSPARDVRLRSGRLPHGCCEAVALTAPARLGSTLRLARGVRVRIVGRGALTRGLVTSPSDLGRKSLLVASFDGAFGRLVSAHGSTVLTTAFLEPARVHAFALGDLRRRLREAAGRLVRGDPLIRTSAPLGVLADLDRRGRVARERLLLVAGEGAALILAFAAFVATARRREAGVADAQLIDLGAARWQRTTARAAELLIPGLAGTALAVAGVAVGALAVARHRDLPSGFVGEALPLGTLLVMVGVGLSGTLLLFGSLGARGRARFGAGAFELAALTALGLIIWQSAVTGALDPDTVARSGTAPVILLVPALAFLSAAVLLLRIVPAALRVGQRLGRSRPLVRLALVTAARNPRQAAAATTFLAVAVGSSLFSVDYLATIDRQARDAARFAVGAPWRSGNQAGGGTPGLRLDGAVNQAEPSGAQRAVRVLALPAGDLPRVLGWRDGFSDVSRAEIARRLRPTPVRLRGPALSPDVTAVRVWARAETDYPRQIVLHFLLPDQRFARVDLGAVFHRWKLLSTSVPGLGGAQLVGVQYEPTYTPISFKYDPKGFVDLGPIEQRGAAGWSALPSIGRWNPTTSPDGRSGVLYAAQFHGAPVTDGTRFELSGTFQPLVHPRASLPPPVPGFQIGVLPALVGEPEAAQAVDGLLTLVVAGKAVPVRVIARASLFPTIANRPRDFVVLDYDTLFAALNADQPGIAVPRERWHFGGTPTTAALAADRVEARLRDDPLARGTRTVLAVTAVVAAVLGLIGLLVATGAAVRSERLALAEYEALGISPRSLGRSVQLRLVVLSVVGIAAGVVGGFAGVRLVGALVAVTGTGGRPLPPIVSIVDWTAAVLIVAALCAGALLAARLIAARAVREPVARRLRA